MHRLAMYPASTGVSILIETIILRHVQKSISYLTISDINIWRQGANDRAVD